MKTGLPALLREMREAQGTSLRMAARDLGVDPAHLSRLERGKKAPSRAVLERAAKYYSIADEVLERASGEVPDDVLEILRNHPDLVDRIRAEYGHK